MDQETYQRQLSVAEFRELSALRINVEQQQESMLKIMRRLGIVGATFAETASRAIQRIDELEAELQRIRKS